MGLTLLVAVAGARAWHTGSSFHASPGSGGGGGLFYTGSPLDRGWTCAACHVDPPGRLRVDIQSEPDLFVTRTYAAGQRYSVTVRMRNEELGLESGRSNFNSMALSVLDDDALPLGTLSGNEDFFIRSNASGTAGFMASQSRMAGQTEWTFSWTAPQAEAAVPLTFYLAVVDGNGADSRPDETRTDPFGDDVAVAPIRLTPQ